MTCIRTSSCMLGKVVAAMLLNCWTGGSINYHLKLMLCINTDFLMSDYLCVCDKWQTTMFFCISGTTSLRLAPHPFTQKRTHAASRRWNELNYLCEMKYNWIWSMGYCQLSSRRLFLYVCVGLTILNCCNLTTLNVIHLLAATTVVIIQILLTGGNLQLNLRCNIILPPWRDVCVIVCIRAVQCWQSDATRLSWLCSSHHWVFPFRSSRNRQLPAESNLVLTRSRKGERESLRPWFIACFTAVWEKCILGSALTPSDKNECHSPERSCQWAGNGLREGKRHSLHSRCPTADTQGCTNMNRSCKKAAALN